MAKCRNIFFDVGNTLLFPNRARMLAPISADRHPTLESWQALERRTKHEFDQGLMEGRVDRGFWWTFHTYLLQQLNSEDEAVRDTLVENTQNSANWDQILPGTRDALERLQAAICDCGDLKCRRQDRRRVAALRDCGLLCQHY